MNVDRFYKLVKRRMLKNTKDIFLGRQIKNLNIKSTPDNPG